MSINDSIRQAAAAIGKNKEQDYRLKLSEHPNELQASAPALIDILESSVVAGTRQQYEKKDRKAIEAQHEFTHVFNRANKLVLLTAILTALVLTIGILSPELQKFSKDLEKVLLMALSIGSVAAGAFASKDLYMVRQGKLLEEWMTTRASAESKRLEYFMEVINADRTPAEDGLSIELLKLEYFRRFQLETQLTYFDKRGDDKRLAANQNLKQSGLTVAGAAIVTGAAAISSTADAKFAAIASLGAVFSAISSYTALKEQIFQNQQISERYAATFDSLQDLYKRMDATREAVMQSGREPLVHFVESVHEILLAEHKKWLGEQEQRSQSLAKLDELLATANARKESKKAEPETNGMRPAPADLQPAPKPNNEPAPKAQAPADEEVPAVQDVVAGSPVREAETPATNGADGDTDSAESAVGEEMEPEVITDGETADSGAENEEVPAVKKDAGMFQ